MANLADLVVMTVSSAFGTSATIPLSSAAKLNGVNYLSFASAGTAGGTLVDYSILDPLNGGSEIGTATYTSSNTTLTGRTPTVSTTSSFITGSSGSLVRASPRAETLPKLDVTNSYSSAADNYFKSGRPWADVRAWGAKGDSVTDDSSAIQQAINYLSGAYSGGIVFFPPGNYSVQSGITTSSGIHLFGAGQGVSVIQNWHTDVTPVTVSGNFGGVYNVTIFGKGLNNDTGSFGAVGSNALVVHNVGNIIRDVTAWGGVSAAFIDGVDNVFENVDFSLSYGSQLVLTSGANWYVRVRMDHEPVAVAVTNAPPFPAWAASTPTAQGHVVTVGTSLGNFAICCTASGTTSSGSAPTAKNYGINITDGTVTWQLLSPASYIGLSQQGNGENHYVQNDLTSPAFVNSLQFLPSGSSIGPSVCCMTDSVLSAGAVINSSGMTTSWLNLSNNEIGGLVAINAGYIGCATFNQNFAVASSATGFSFAPGVSNFSVMGNILGGGAITVSSNCDHFNVVANVKCTVANASTVVNQYVAGNVA